MADADCLHCKLMPQVAEFAKTHDDDQTIGALVNCVGDFILLRPDLADRYILFAKSIATLSRIVSSHLGHLSTRQVGHG